MIKYREIKYRRFYENTRSGVRQTEIVHLLFMFVQIYNYFG